MTVATFQKVPRSVRTCWEPRNRTANVEPLSAAGAAAPSDAEFPCGWLNGLMRLCNITAHNALKITKRRKRQLSLISLSTAIISIIYRQLLPFPINSVRMTYADIQILLQFDIGDDWHFSQNDNCLYLVIFNTGPNLDY